MMHGAPHVVLIFYFFPNTYRKGGGGPLSYQNRT